jgi:hypothetical protein
VTEEQHAAALARLEALERAATQLERSAQERTDAAVARSEELTRGLDDGLRAHVQQSVAEVRAEVQQAVAELRGHVQELVEAATREAREAREAATRSAPAANVAPPDTALLAEEGRRQASASIEASIDARIREHTANLTDDVRRQATTSIDDEVRRRVANLADDVRTQAATSVGDEVRRQAASAVAEELRRQAATRPAAVPIALEPGTTEEVVAQLRAEIEERIASVGAAARRAEVMAGQFEQLISGADTRLQEAQADRQAATFALRESRAELEAAKRSLDLTDSALTLKGLRRTQRLLYGTLVLSIVAIALALWALLS